MASVINSFAIAGIDGYTVKIEIDTIFGQPSVSIVGLGDTAVKEAKERLEAAIVNSNFEFPKMKIVINLSPSYIKKSGSHFDLGMAIALLIQSKQIAVEDIGSYGFIGELSLNGELRAGTGILPMVIEAKSKGIKNIIVPNENLQEANLVNDINVFGFETLKDVILFLEGKEIYSESFLKNEISNKKDSIVQDFNDIKGQDAIIEFIVVAAAGGHNLMMTGAPGCGKSMIAKRIPGILPEMTEKEALEVTKIYSVAGLLKSKEALISNRPFRAPHHNASINSLIGGGANALPGEISLAHNGVLFLDEIGEFNRKTLDSLRQPMEDGFVTISRVKYTHVFPANFMFIAAMNPCPCGYYGHERCKCSEKDVLKYREKISGPILDRIDIQKYVQPVDFIEIVGNGRGVSSKELKSRIEFARNIQRKRFEKIQNVNCNAQMLPVHINEFCKIDNESRNLLQLAFDKFHYSARTFHKFLKISRTFADLDGSEKIRKKDVARALVSRDMEKEQNKIYEIKSI